MTKQIYPHHPYPWKADNWRILEANGWVIGNYPFTLGDELDHASGELMSKAPELQEAAMGALEAINKVLSIETLTPGGRKALEVAKRHLLEVV